MQLNNKIQLHFYQISKNLHLLETIKIKKGLLTRQKMQKLSSFLQKSIEIISQKTVTSIEQLKDDIDKDNEIKKDEFFGQQNQYQKQHGIKSLDDNQEAQIIPLTVESISLKTERPLDNIQLQLSDVTQQQAKPTPTLPQIKKSRSIKINSSKPLINESRIRQIQQQKRRILSQLKKLDSEIVEIKKQQHQQDFADRQSIQKMQRSNFHKKTQISDDIQAKRQAQSLIKQLHLQKKKIQQKKRKMQEIELQKRKKQQQQRKKQRQQLQKRMKEQKRFLIEKRLQGDRKKREQRKIVDKQSNLLIMELKKQQQLQKQQKLIPGQLQQYQQKKKLLEKKNIFNYQQIQQHQKKYQQIKSIEKQLKRQRSESIKLSKPSVPKYGKNIWVERLQQEHLRKKEQEKMKELAKKVQLQKRMQYGAAVKSMFLSKYHNSANKKRELQEIENIKTNHESSVIQEEKNESFKQPSESHTQQKKPQTPNPQSHLPIIQKRQLRQNKTDKKFKSRQNNQQDKNSIVQSKIKKRLSSRSREEIKQFEKQKDPQEIEKLKKQKQRELQLRRQTKERLKKLESHSIEIPKPQKIKYQNYMSKVKLKKQSPHQQWKKIMSNQNLSKEQKYKEMLSKAAHMQNQAKIKQDLRKNGDSDAVNLYIGSIQAKLALLQKF